MIDKCYFFGRKTILLFCLTNSLLIVNLFIKGLVLIQKSEDLHIYFTNERGRGACSHEELAGLKKLSLPKNNSKNELAVWIFIPDKSGLHQFYI